MADKKISQLTNLTGANLADNDEFVLVDTSADETKAITWSELKEGLDTGTGFVRITGDTMTGDLSFNGGDTIYGDNDKAIFGAGSDLQIYHSGSHSYITDTGTGSLYIRGTNTVLTSAAGETYANFVADGETSLYYNGTKTIKTTSTGVDVTGTITSDGLTVDDTSAYSSYVNGGTINLSGLDASSINRNFATVKGLSVGSNTGALSVETLVAGSSLERMRVDYNGDISFYEDTGTTPKFFWDASAESLGIGTSSPSTPLHVNGAGTISGITYSTAFVNTSNGTSYFTDASTGNGIYVGGSTGSPANTVRLLTNASEAMRIDSDGNVGIGTSSPSALLHVDGTAGDLIKVTSPSVGTGYIGVESGYTYINANTGGASLRFETQGSERMRIDSSGNLLVGTTNPELTGSDDAITAKTAGGNETLLGIRHDSSATSGAFFVGFSYNGSIIGSISQSGTTGVAYNTSSDYRLKEDVQPMTGASARVQSLKPCNFAWKADGSRTDGFLAHEAQAVVPEAVTGEKDGEEMQAIDQSKLVPLLTAALQEALTEIDALKTRITALEG